MAAKTAPDYVRLMAMFQVHGLTRSYFTRKVTGFLDYTDRAWRLEPTFLDHERATAAGWNGGIPVVSTPDGTPMWDSTSIIEHLDTATSVERSVLPDDPTLRFLAYLIDDFSDEWFYRPAVGSRWSYPANTATASWQIAEEMSIGRPIAAATVQEMSTELMTGSLAKLGVTADNIDAWMSEVYVSWLRTLDRHFERFDYLLGQRPCLADFALFGANAAHFVGDPHCRALADEHGPGVVAHTGRLQLPWRQHFGNWIDASSIPETLIGVISEAGRHYLPWVAAATVDGSATVEFGDGVTARIDTSPFLDRARGIMLARYLDARSEQLDAILDRAGVLTYYADYTSQATAVPDPVPPAQPDDNRPYAVT